MVEEPLWSSYGALMSFLAGRSGRCDFGREVSAVALRVCTARACATCACACVRPARVGRAALGAARASGWGLAPCACSRREAPFGRPVCLRGLCVLASVACRDERMERGFGRRDRELYGTGAGHSDRVVDEVGDERIEVSSR